VVEAASRAQTPLSPVANNGSIPDLYPPRVGSGTAASIEVSVVDDAGFFFVDRGKSVSLIAH
jgi:hypothetical protein